MSQPRSEMRWLCRQCAHPPYGVPYSHAGATLPVSVTVLARPRSAPTMCWPGLRGNGSNRPPSSGLSLQWVAQERQWVQSSVQELPPIRLAVGTLRHAVRELPRKPPSTCDDSVVFLPIGELWDCWAETRTRLSLAHALGCRLEIRQPAVRDPDVRPYLASPSPHRPGRGLVEGRLTRGIGGRVDPAERS